MASLKIGDSPGKIMFRVKRQLRVKNSVYPQNTAQQIKGAKKGNCKQYNPRDGYQKFGSKKRIVT